MANTKNAASSIHIDTRFDRFLFAVIGESKSGMSITVLSALARLNLDPWNKAAELSGLPAGAAGQRLASLVMELPDFSPAGLGAGAIDRLVTLLPTREVAPAGAHLLGFSLPANARAIIVYVILMAVMTGAEHLWESSRLQSQAAGVHAAVPGAVLSATSQAKSNP